MNSDKGAITPGMPQNEANPNNFRSFNTFPMSYDHKLTCRYGDITPFFVFDSWSDDKVPFASWHDFRNYTMSSVFQERLKMYKDYFLVPMKAILPRAWDYYIANPNQLEDIPDDAAPWISSTTIKAFWQQYSLFYNSDYRTRLINEFDFQSVLSLYVKYTILIENVFSDGGLLSYLGCKLSKYISSPNDAGYTLESYLSFFYEQLKKFISENVVRLYIPHLYRNYYLDDDFDYPNNPDYVTFHKFIELMRENSDFELVCSDESASNLTLWNDLPLRISNYIDTLSVNVSRLGAYQISCAHFMTNDKVDSIYSADLYRSMLETDYLAVNPIATYTMNGVTHLYDVLSQRVLDWAFGVSQYNLTTAEIMDHLTEKINYLYHLTSYRKSLKFGNYFTGSRTRPLAVGDVNAPVVDNSVSAIDITKNIAMQRFLNAVNKTGRKISEYSRKIIGGYVQPVDTDPKFLARDSIAIGSQEVENTSNTNTGKIVTNLRSEQSKFAFECEVSLPSIILGLVSFECKPTYSRTIDRHFFHKDRFDLFNSYFQNIGDQEIYRGEKGLGTARTPFAYQLRHMEYKQRYSIASGGYVDYLPSWSFIVDNPAGSEKGDLNLTSDFIRSSNSDFDRFYTSLTGYTLSSYFHFNIWFINECTPLRNMEFSPTIL